MLRRFARDLLLGLYYVLENYPELVKVTMAFLIATGLLLFVAIGLPLLGPGWLFGIFFVCVVAWAAVKDARGPKKSFRELEGELNEIVKKGRPS